jgi:hypothetical protein
MKTKQDLFIHCNNKDCNAKLDFNKVQVFKLLTPLVIHAITQNQYDKVWVCSECKHTNRLLETKVTKEILQEPYFLKVVPSPPSQKDGMIDRSKFHIKFSTWFWKFISELEAQSAQFRDDNWQKTDEMYAESDQIEDDGQEG